MLHKDVLVLPTVDHILWDEIKCQRVLYRGVPLVHDLLHDRRVAYHFYLFTLESKIYR